MVGTEGWHAGRRGWGCGAVTAVWGWMRSGARAELCCGASWAVVLVVTALPSLLAVGDAHARAHAGAPSHIKGAPRASKLPPATKETVRTHSGSGLCLDQRSAVIHNLVDLWDREQGGGVTVCVDHKQSLSAPAWEGHGQAEAWPAPATYGCLGDAQAGMGVAGKPVP